MSDDEALSKIREIRSLPSPKLKPSHFLRTSFRNDDGVDVDIKLRDYQSRGIMNMLVMPRMILGDDTGLGKTLQTLSVCGYVWLREPEYVPIVVTRKSALFQWGAEVEKFMQGMEVVVVDGEPHERNSMYEDFFLRHDPARKRLLIITYETLFRDMDEAVVRDRSAKPSKDAKKALRDAQEARKTATEAKTATLHALQARFSGRGFDIEEHVRSVLRPSDPTAKPPPAPAGWTSSDDDFLRDVEAVRERVKAAEAAVKAAKDGAEPPKRVAGVLNMAKEMLTNVPGCKLMLILDELHTLKNYRGKTHESIRELSLLCERIYGMTATPVKNRLMEFFALFRIVHPGLFPKVTGFQNEYCVTKLQSIGKGRQVPVVVGYKNLDAFVRKIEPYYLSRKKHEVAAELPQLVTRELVCPLYDLQEELYDLAESGLLQKADEADSNAAELLSSMVLIQEACNSPELIADEDGNQYQGPSSKVDTLVDLFENELEGVKTIVFSRFERMISVVERELKAKGIKCVRITGKENKASDREKAKALFQSPTSGTDVILITTAGSESINRQAAEHIVFLDSPWSWGDYVQLIGRAIRIGSVHAMVMATHLVARKRNGAKTIDDHVNKKLREKKVLADKVAGENLKGGLEFQASEEVMDIFAEIRKSVLAGDKGAVAAAQARMAAPKTKAVGHSKKPGRKVPAQASPPADEVPTIPIIDLSDI